MFDKLARLLVRPLQQPDPMRRHLAMAVLLVEAARADFDDHAAERRTMCDRLVSSLRLDRADAEALVDRAFAQSHAAVSLHEFLRVLNTELDAPAKVDLLESLWRVAYADGRVDPLEESRIRQLADLLFIPHSDFVRLRLKVATQVQAGA